MLCFIGTCAGVIDIVTKWLSDIKLGVCNGKFWLNKESCCWSSFKNASFNKNLTIVSVVSSDCPDWLTWSEIFGINEEVSDDMLETKKNQICVVLRRSVQPVARPIYAAYSASATQL